ncbi:hypothetical protein Pelo_16065 [Pelomyxa schiedti]|nr:hypothetical protein Pelo_16065 [Pelomyxa schiedti]
MNLQRVLAGAPSPMPPAEHVVWARDQLVAMCSGGIVGRCASVSPLRVLPHHVLCHEIGRNWIMGVAKSVVVTSRKDLRMETSLTAVWFVSVSHTLGVVSVARERRQCARWIYGWLDRDHVATCSINPSLHAVIVEAEESCEVVVARWQFCTYFGTLVVSNSRWQLLCNSGRGVAVPIWPKPLVTATTSNGRAADSVRIVSIGDSADHVNWIDLMHTGNGNCAAVSVLMKKGNNVLWLVDLEKSHQQGEFSIIQEFQLYSERKALYWSDQHGFIGSPQLWATPLGRTSTPNECFIVHLETNQVVSHRASYFGKVDDSHFYEVSGISEEFPGTLSVFAKNDESTPCCVFTVSREYQFIIRNGLVAFEGFGRIDLVDAVTGRWLWIADVEDEYNEEEADETPLCCVANISGKVFCREPEFNGFERGVRGFTVNWIMGVAKSVVVGSYRYGCGYSPWFVSVSHTLGVVEVGQVRDCQKSGLAIHGWVDRFHVAAYIYDPGSPAFASHSAIMEVESMHEVAEIENFGFWSALMRGSTVVSNSRWQAVYSTDKKRVSMWPKPVETTNNGRATYAVRIVSIGDETDHINWIDFMNTGNCNCAAVSVAIGKGESLLLFVDLEKSYKQGEFSITQEFQLGQDHYGTLFWSDKHGFIAQSEITEATSLYPADTREWLQVDLETNQVVKHCASRLGKVDETHFYEVSGVSYHTPGTVSVFARNDDTPCRVFPVGVCSQFIIHNGLIAFCRAGRIDLVDAVTGCWLWCQCVPQKNGRQLRFSSL